MDANLRCISVFWNRGQFEWYNAKKSQANWFSPFTSPFSLPLDFFYEFSKTLQSCQFSKGSPIEKEQVKDLGYIYISKSWWFFNEWSEMLYYTCLLEIPTRIFFWKQYLVTEPTTSKRFWTWMCHYLMNTSTNCTRYVILEKKINISHCIYKYFAIKSLFFVYFC